MSTYSRREALAASLFGTISLALPAVARAGGAQKPSKMPPADAGEYILPPSGASAVTGLAVRAVLRSARPDEVDAWMDAQEDDVCVDVYVQNTGAQPVDLVHHVNRSGAMMAATAMHGGKALDEALHISQVSRMMPRQQWVAAAPGKEALVSTQRFALPEGVAAKDLRVDLTVTLYLRDGQLVQTLRALALDPALG